MNADSEKVRPCWSACSPLVGGTHGCFMDHRSINLQPKEEGEGARGSGLLGAITANDMLSCELWP